MNECGVKGRLCRTNIYFLSVSEWFGAEKVKFALKVKLNSCLVSSLSLRNEPECQEGKYGIQPASFLPPLNDLPVRVHFCVGGAERTHWPSHLSAPLLSDSQTQRHPAEILAITSLELAAVNTWGVSSHFISSLHFLPSVLKYLSSLSYISVLSPAAFKFMSLRCVWMEANFSVNCNLIILWIYNLSVIDFFYDCNCSPRIDRLKMVGQIWNMEYTAPVCLDGANRASWGSHHCLWV